MTEKSNNQIWEQIHKLQEERESVKPESRKGKDIQLQINALFWVLHKEYAAQTWLYAFQSSDED